MNTDYTYLYQPKWSDIICYKHVCWTSYEPNQLTLVASAQWANQLLLVLQYQMCSAFHVLLDSLIRFVSENWVVGRVNNKFKKGRKTISNIWTFWIIFKNIRTNLINNPNPNE